MINDRTSSPLSMKTTPGHAVKPVLRQALTAPSSSKEGDAIIYQDRVKDCYSSVPLVPLLEWSDLRGFAPDGGMD